MLPSETTLLQIFTAMSAAEVAEHFLSPYAHRQLMNFITAESGPAMWIVNRSDVYDETLKKLQSHPLPDIAARAKEKLRQRHSSLIPLDPPVLERPVEETPDQEVEDVLGHPLCSFEAILFFSKSLNPDHRASAALSLSRRILEHPPNWDYDLDLKKQIQDRFSQLLLEDSSEYVRAYVARVPILSESAIAQAALKEKHPVVLARILQNPAATELVVQQVSAARQDIAAAVGAIDERLKTTFRSEQMKRSDCGPLLRGLHEASLRYASE